jgi:indoleamine 2,3-dioxygenase
MNSTRLRHFLDDLPECDMAALLPGMDDAQKRLAMVRWSFLVQAYVWGEGHPPEHLPRNLAVPYCALAESIGQFPLLPYSAYTLDNWAKLEPSGEAALGNIRTLQNFRGGLDEDWFILVHVEIEAKAGPALAAIPGILDAVAADAPEAVRDGLEKMLAAWTLINPVFDRMPEGCDPYIYFHRVRPYIHGWRDNPAFPAGGLVYEGVEKFGGRPQGFRGQTGSQSSIVPVMDALLGVSHKDDPLKSYLDELHFYRPPGHRAFIDDVRAAGRLRDFVAGTGHRDLKDLYNAVIEAVYKFRARHLEYAASYIHKQASRHAGNDPDVGTGGTPFMKYLKKHRDECEAHLL